MERHLEMIENLRLELRARSLETDARIQQAADQCKRGAITPDELRRCRYEETGRLEQKLWQTLEGFRTAARESEREGFRKVTLTVADALERMLRKGHGHA
jgi:hypothetical protein